jgi:hypothetical protein
MKQSAQIIPFPIDLETFFIRTEAQGLLKRDTPEKANRAWSIQCSRISARLRVQGRTPEEINDELDRLTALVREEIQRQQQSFQARKSA